jgi:hypothetical protein
MTKARGKQSGFLDQLVAGLGLGPQPPEEEKLPYCLRRDILSAEELVFCKVLQQAAEGWAVVCPKVGLVEIFFPKTGDPATNRQYWAKLLPRNVDFLLCDPEMMRPVIGVELVDPGDQPEERKARDAFLSQVFEDAGLPLLRMPVGETYDAADLRADLRLRSGQPILPSEPAGEGRGASSGGAPAYAAPRCPECGKEMIPRTVRQDGPHFGRKYWGCSDFPRCRGVREFRSGR